MSHEAGTRRLLPRHDSQEGEPEFRPGGEGTEGERGRLTGSRGKLYR